MKPLKAWATSFPIPCRRVDSRTWDWPAEAFRSASRSSASSRSVAVALAAMFPVALPFDARPSASAAAGGDAEARTALIALDSGEESPMPRAIWSGSISFGLVNVPVKLFPAVHHQGLSFHQFQEGTNARVRNKRVSEKTGKEVAYEDIVKGYEVKKGQYVMVDPDELASYRPESTKAIDISDFVDLDEIDPIYYENTYYLAPDGKAAEKPYRLLLEAMEKKGKVAIGKLVLRTKQYLSAIRPLDGVLA